MPSAEGKTIDSATLDISVKRSELLRELSIAQGVVERKSTIPVLSHFLFETSGPNLLITATDTEVGLRTFCPATVRQPGSCTLPARKLFDYVRLLTDGDMTLKALDHGWAQIRSGRSVTKMVGLPRDTFPQLPLYPAGSAVRVSAPIFRAMITRTLFAVSQEEGKYALDGVLLILQPTTISMVATDGNRLAHVEASASVTGLKEDIRVLIPKKALSQLGMLLSSGTIEAFEFAKNDSSLFFRIGGRLLTCRQLLGNFPNYEPILRQDYRGSVVVPSEELAQAIQRVSQFSDDRASSIRLDVDSEQLSLSSSSPEIGESKELLEASYKGPPLTASFNSRFLTEFLQAVESDTVQFHFKDPTAAAEFRPTGNGENRYRYIVMPMRT